MVPYYISALLQSDVYSLKRIIDCKCVGILDEDGIHMAQRLAAGDLRTFDEDESEVVGFLFGNFIRRIVVSLHKILKRTILQMVGHRNRVQTLLPRLIHTHIRPHGAV